MLFGILEHLAYLLLCAMHQSAGKVVRHYLDEVDAHLLSHLLGKERFATSSRTIEEH